MNNGTTTNRFATEEEILRAQWTCLSARAKEHHDRAWAAHDRGDMKGYAVGLDARHVLLGGPMARIRRELRDRHGVDIVAEAKA